MSMTWPNIEQEVPYQLLVLPEADRKNYQVNEGDKSEEENPCQSVSAWLTNLTRLLAFFTVSFLFSPLFSRSDVSLWIQF